MRRAVTWLILAALAVAAFVVVRGVPGRSSGYTVDAIFDTTSGLIPGNNVMIAGARVGTVSGITLTPGYKARVQMSIDRRYAPFHADARCQIRPVALVGEMEVDCDPGRSGTLAPSAHAPPTVQLAMTTVPVDLTDLFDIWSAPVSQRLSVALWTLGAGLAGRGQDLNGVLERSNPTLTLARETISTLDQQRAQLGSLIDSSDRLLARVTPNRVAVQRFVDQAAAVTTVTGEHRGALAQSIRRLPGLLGAARPALNQLDEFAANATPVLADLHAAAPNVNRMTGELSPLAVAGLPALQRLGSFATTGLHAVPALNPLASQLSQFAHGALPVAQLLSQFFPSLRERGFVEGLNDITYYVGSSMALFDQTSHLSANDFLDSGCAGASESQYSACSAKYNQTGGSGSASSFSARSPGRRHARALAVSGQSGRAGAAPAAGGGASPGASLPPPPQLPTTELQTLKSLANYFFK
jgi:virulence factor Mce-like protein